MTQEQAASKPMNKKKIIVWICIAAVILLLALLLFLKGGVLSGKPVLEIETPQKISASSQEELTLDVTISDLGEVIYPAASMSVGFDSSRLEFLGVSEGNVFVTNPQNSAGVDRKLPEWSVNIDKSNETGQINIMYLDLTGGTCAFSKDLLDSGDNVLMRLSFRLRGSAKKGDVCELNIKDAVFAASDEADSLASRQKTLTTKNSKIVVGE